MNNYSPIRTQRDCRQQVKKTRVWVYAGPNCVSGRNPFLLHLLKLKTETLRMVTISVSGPYPKQLIKIRPNKLIIIQDGSWEDYSTLATEDLKVEFIQNRIYIQSPASLIHEEIFGFLLTELRFFLKKNPIGKVLGSRFPVEIDAQRRVEPDIFFLSAQDLEEGELSETLFKGNPSWIIEIVSPNYREHDTVTKKDIYQSIGVNEYWIIDPEYKTLEIIRYQNKDLYFNETITKGKMGPRIAGFDGFRIDVPRMFQIA